MAERSASEEILDVACRSRARRASSFDIPQPSSRTRILSTPPLSSSTSTRVAPASRAFSTSSLTTDAGFSTTSPAAIRSITSPARRWIFGTSVGRKDNASADDGLDDFDLPDAAGFDGERIGGEHDEVGELARGEAPLLVFLEGGPRGAGGVRPKGFLHTDALPAEPARRILPVDRSAGHGGVNPGNRGQRSDVPVGPEGELRLRVEERAKRIARPAAVLTDPLLGPAAV